EERTEHLASQLMRRAVDATALVHRHALAQVRGELLEPDGMPRHEAEGLHVHDEAVWRALGPAADHALVRHAVERRVHLDGREVLRVPGEALAGRNPGRVPLLRQ